MKTEIIFNFNGVDYKVQKGSKTVNYANSCFSVDFEKYPEGIKTRKELMNEVIEYNAIENINFKLPQLLEDEGFDDLVKPNLNEFIQTLEFEEFGFRELSVLANLEQVFIYSDNYFKLSGKNNHYIIIDREGNLRS